ncbi:BTC protein, partial [Rhinopomastus cyanomelas]|nr:BTC protein [Rhinopomastus cyanomelas]
MEAAAAAPLPAPGGGPSPLLLCLALAFGKNTVPARCSPSTRRPGPVPSPLSQNTTQLRWQGHFSRCPEEYKHYCVKGRCRFLMAEKTPACVCERGYTGPRCERVDIFYLRGDQGQIVIISLIATIVTLIILIICACICAHHCRKQRRKRKAEEMETLNKNSASRSDDVPETGTA